MTANELLYYGNKYKKEGNFEEALKMYKQLWVLEKNQWNGYYLALCLRKCDNFSEARDLHNELEKVYRNFIPLKNDKLWLDYSEKIKNRQNPNLLTDAEDILSRADMYNRYTSSVYTKTVLNVVKYLCSIFEYVEAYNWLLRLDQSIISNSVYHIQGKTIAADRKIYFVLFADVLIHLNKHTEYVEFCLESLNFNITKLSEFKNRILEDITFGGQNARVNFVRNKLGEITIVNYISRVKLARHIKNFQEEFYFRLNKAPNVIFNNDKTTLISDLSHYLFCPVSFAINETFKIEANTSWEKDEWLGEKKLFIDRHIIFNRTNSYKDTFEDSQIKDDFELFLDFDYLFKSVIKVNNVTNPKLTIYSNRSGDLKGAPDYVMEDSSGVLFAITEKFSSIYSADIHTPFESDLVKHYAFIHELDNLNIKFGYLITWYWKLIDINTDNESVKKKIIINSYRLTRIDSSEINSNKLNCTIDNIKNFKKSKQIEVDVDKILIPNKCLNCSVFSYCNHKTGNFNNINLPYDLSLNHILSDPKVED